MIIDTFTGACTSAYAAFDTETKTYIDGEILPEEKIAEMCAATDSRGEPVYPVSWWRRHAEVRAWAYIVYTPEGFAIAETFDEFQRVITERRIRFGWWYHAPFDMAVLDYDMLSRGFRYCKDAREPNTFSELVSDYGARYDVKVVFPTRSGRHVLHMYDLRNILQGGLARLLEDYKVTDGQGNPIRKLEMDYQGATGSAADIEYMLADAAGLWWLVRIASLRLEEVYNISIRGGRPDVLTASGLAKRYVLRRMYPNVHKDFILPKYFQKDHPITLAEDTYFRQHGLLGGGLCAVNPRYRGRVLTGIEAYRNDANSHYPAYMADMLSVWGHPEYFDSVEKACNYFRWGKDCFILEFDELTARMWPYMVPAWRDPFTAKIVDSINHTVGRPSLLMFAEEFEELANWYDFTGARLRRVICYKCRKEPAIEAVMREEFDRKNAAKRAGDKALQNNAKFVMNGYSGKYSQNPNHCDFDRGILPDGAVHRVELLDTLKADPSSLMQVVQGSRITCNGRVRIRQAIRAAYGKDVAKLFLYTDTDSFHGLKKYESADPYRLGEFKQENDTPIVEACFLAPKTYYEIEADGTVSISSKGVRNESIEELYKSGVPLRDIYRLGRRILSKSALNVRGGKALLPLPKYIAKITNNIDERWE